ncbi:Sec-independent protein translocase protein TatB [Paenochrobactrum sp. BZR 201-1]|uniref:Sec-independent protein translocase protein TatB n=1 Tax=Paenochrobactrum sp. BZR 201-1 TaxID=3378075 RepID=UPI003853C342
MLDVGWSEILVIAIVMVVVVGPKDLPKMLRAFGKATARMRTTANEFKRQFDEALKEAELDDVKNIIDETRKLDPRGKMTQVFDPIRSAGNDLKASLNQSPKPEQSAKPVDSSVYKDAEKTVEAEASAPVIETKSPSDAIAEAVKKNLSDETPEKVKADVVKQVKTKPAPKTKKTAKAAGPAPAKTPAAKAAAKPANTTAAKAALAKTADAKPAAPKKVTTKKAPAKKPAAKTTGTNE